MSETKKNDSGATGSQIKSLTDKIDDLVGHLKAHKKDFGSRRGLLQMVGKRRRLLSYLKRKNLQEYQNLVKKLKLKG